ncbi:DUF4286 family protein [Flavimarina sp. Hel_I_48]|uniref:DUF4286 family protein n=1 Tax=Flavimarina sp. Hel_I_48 TaxID=1392488 RepID=UPI0004DFBBAE|nr:DUF4286 family protein [Flavimarina sp. Hel_I_48]
MIIYNVTTNVEESIHDEWLQWMRDEHIPAVLASGKFSKAIMTRVLVEESMGGISYSTQYTTENKATLERYYSEDAPALRKDAERFAGKFVSFRTELEVITELHSE